MHLYIELAGNADDQGVWIQEKMPGVEDGVSYILTTGDPFFPIINEREARSWLEQTFKPAFVDTIDNVFFI